VALSFVNFMHALYSLIVGGRHLQNMPTVTDITHPSYDAAKGRFAHSSPAVSLPTSALAALSKRSARRSLESGMSSG